MSDHHDSPSATSPADLTERRSASDEDEGEQQWPGYDRDATIAAISGLYETLQRMYLPPGSLQYPPPEGWTWPAGTTFSPAKSDTVLELMRHVPKLVRPTAWSSLQIYEATEAVDCSFSWATEGATFDVDPRLYLTTLPPHVLMIGQTFGRNGHHIFLDTERGTVTVCDFQVGPTTFTDLAQVRP